LPEDAWIGQGPHSIEQQTSLRSRPEFIAGRDQQRTALSWPIPNTATSLGLRWR
jgi:hypothetical protein